MFQVSGYENDPKISKEGDGEGKATTKQRRNKEKIRLKGRI
jgi:hypothetical protein